MTMEEIVHRWQPEANSQLQQWIRELKRLGRHSDELLAERDALRTAQQAAAGRQMLARFKADAAAITQADAHFAQLEAAIGQLDAQLITLRAQETALETQIYQADEYLQGIMARLEQGLTRATTTGQLSDRVDTEFMTHERRVQQLLRGEKHGEENNQIS